MSGSAAAPQDSPPAAPADEVRLRRDLRAMVADGMAFSGMVGLGETYVAAFVLAAGLGAVSAAWIASLPMLAGAVLQLATPAGVRRLGSYRRWVVLCAALQGLTFAPLVAAALLGRISAPVAFGTMAAYWGFGMATSPAWNAWVGALVPPGRRATFFAGRSRWCQAALFTAILAGGAILHWGEGSGSPVGVFALPFALAGLLRLVSARFLASQSEPAGLASGHRVSVSPRGALASVRGTPAARGLVYLLAMQVSVHVSAPFFVPFLLGPIGLRYGEFTLLTGAAFAARVAALPALGRRAHARGTASLLRLGAVGIAPLPVLWLASDAFGYLLLLQVLGGAAWAALELGTVLLFFDGLPERERASVLTLFNLANTVAMAVGALLGGAAFTLLGRGLPAYAALFLASTLARTAAVRLLPLRAPRVPPGEHVELRTLAVRPSAGAVQRPVLPTLAEPAPEEPPGRAADA